MAIIYSYPLITTPNNEDLLVITDSSETSGRKNRTKNITVENLANYITTSTSGITGSGTLNTIAMFTPTGNEIGDSLITQAALGQGINVNTNLDVTDDFTVAGSIQCNQSLTVEGISTFNDDATFYNQATFESIASFQNEVQDETSSSGALNEVLTSTGSGNVRWKSYSESGATFLGWARYDGTPSFSTGTEVTVLDGNYIDPPVSLVTNQIIDPYTNGVSGKFVFTSNDLNAVYSLTVVFKASAANANQTHVDIDFVSGATDYERLSKSIGFYKGNNVVDNFHEMFQFYVDSDLITYGLQPRLYAQGGDVKFGDVIFFIQKQQQPAI